MSGVDGIGKHNKQDIDCEFTDNSLDLRILNFNGKNWRLKIPSLNNLIDPAASKLKVKSNSVTLELKKKEKKQWSDIKEKKLATQGLGSSKAKKDDDGEPGTALMDMMKELYNTGDDTMKKTIAESWEKSRRENKF